MIQEGVWCFACQKPKTNVNVNVNVVRDIWLHISLYSERLSHMHWPTSGQLCLIELLFERFVKDVARCLPRVVHSREPRPLDQVG
jgi:hypothetical protein